MQNESAFDVIIVGSGAGGGMAAYDLTKAGLRVLLLEAGRDYDPGLETPMFNTNEQAPLRGSATPDKPSFEFYDATVGGGWDVPGEPYAGTDEFQWWRPRMLGGRTNHWDRVSLRFGPYDFKPFSRDGLGFDWPIDYSDVSPWYDAVERLIGVTGQAHGIENTPDSPPGVHLPPPKPRVYETFLIRTFESLGIKVAAMRAAILTQPHNGRPACLYATSCLRGCSIRANFQSPTVLLPSAMATGRLSIQTDALVHRVEVDEQDRAKGVEYVDTRTGTRHTVEAKAVFLAAGSCASIRILFNSANQRHPSGIGNSSGLLGRYLMDSTGTAILAHIPALENIPPQNEDGIHVGHIYVPWWGYEQQRQGKLDFPRGYQIEFRGGWRMPNMGLGNYPNYSSDDTTAYGNGLREEMLRKYGSIVVFGGEGEMIPNEDSYCEIDPRETDQWGLPVLRFHWKWSEHELRQVEHMHQTFATVVNRLAGKVVYKGRMLKGGQMIHESGGIRMGTDKSNSCVDGFGRCWDVQNLFIVDGGVFVSKPHKNPTLTIMALASRASHRIAQRFRDGEFDRNP